MLLLIIIRYHNHAYSGSRLDGEQESFLEYTYKCSKHSDCQYKMRIRFMHTAISWGLFESGEHIEEKTTIQIKRGIDPVFLPFIDSENDRNTPPKTILKRIREMKWADEEVVFPTPLQISNRKNYLAKKVQGPLSQYKYAVNLINWVEENRLRNKEHFEKLSAHQYFTMGFVEYTKNTVCSLSIRWGSLSMSPYMILTPTIYCQ